MAQREIHKYTDAQLKREIARLNDEAAAGKTLRHLDHEDFLAATKYSLDLLAEAARRDDIRARKVA